MYPYYDYQEQKQALSDIHKMLVKNNFLTKLNPAFGTLLGAVRSGKLNTSQNNWDDLDFSIKQENFKQFKDVIVPEFLNLGFHIEYVWMTSYNEIGELTFYRKDDRVDINQVFPATKDDQKYYVHHHWYGEIQLTKGLRADYYDNLKEINLEGLTFYGPADDINHMIDCYGESWKIPCTHEDEYKYWEDSPGVPWWRRDYYKKVLKQID